MDNIFMNKFLIFALLFVLATSQTANIITKGAPKGGKQIGQRKRARPFDRCSIVTCQTGYFCLYGLCKKVDYECINVKCEKGERCKQGKCIQQLHLPRYQICRALGFTQEKQRCTEQLKERCLYDKSSIKVCGYFPNRTHQEFDNECSACSADSPIRFYYKTSCQWAPRICDQSEECLNGACTKILAEHVFDSYRTCNQNKDCKQFQVCGGHKCMKRQELFNYMTSKFRSNSNVFTV